MAEKRMFTKKITDSDAFIEMSSAAQALYFHLNQSADDDGFNNQIQMAMFRSHASVDDLKVLMLKNFIIRFESGVIVIKHWRMHNTLRKDRYNPTNFQEELALLNIKDNGSYSLTCDDGCQVVAERLPQVSIGKYSIDKYSIEKEEFAIAHEYEKLYDDDSFEMKCVNHLINSITSEMPNAKVPNNDQSIDNWCDHIEKMKRLDENSEADIWSALLYATSDSFWKSNIRSTKKFRDKYETLFLQSKNKKNAKPQTQSTNKFNQFPQREYSQTDYSCLEQRLLNKGR